MLVRRIILLTAFSCLLQACTSTPKNVLTEEDRQKNWQQYQVNAERIRQWDIHGRAAIFVDDDVHNVGLSWHQDLAEFSIILQAPFGQGVIRLESSEDDRSPVKLSLSDGRVVYGDNAESALEDVVGFSIPLQGLFWWIRGIPQKLQPFEERLSDEGRLKTLRQNEWQINYIDYFEHASPEQNRPKRLYLKHERLALKIVIERWQKPVAEVSDSELFPSFD